MQEIEPRTEAEAQFLSALLGAMPSLDVWYHADADGTPWLLVSLDFVEANCVQDTLRLDFDGTSVRGGWSPAFLNWDDGVRAPDAEIDLTPPDGIDRAGDPVDLAADSAVWFSEHARRWPNSDRARRWKRT